MKFRLLCFASHLAISFFIALLSVCIVFWLWYPSLLDKALGVTHIFFLLLVVDVVTGPLLTLLVAKQGKKTLKLDLTVVAVLQLIALGYGMYIVAEGRPVWIVYDNNRFEVVQAYEAVTGGSSSAEIPVPLSLTGPIWAAVVNADPESIANGNAYLQQSFLRSYESVKEKAGSNAASLEVLKRVNGSAVVNDMLLKYPEADGYIPLVAKEKLLAVLVDKPTGNIIAIVDASPW